VFKSVSALRYAKYSVYMTSLLVVSRPRFPEVLPFTRGTVMCLHLHKETYRLTLVYNNAPPERFLNESENSLFSLIYSDDATSFRSILCGSKIAKVWREISAKRTNLPKYTVDGIHQNVARILNINFEWNSLAGNVARARQLHSQFQGSGFAATTAESLRLLLQNWLLITRTPSLKGIRLTKKLRTVPYDTLTLEIVLRSRGDTTVNAVLHSWSNFHGRFIIAFIV